MAQGANVKVDLDTAPAKKKLQALGKKGEAAARRVSKGAKGAKGSDEAGFGGGIAKGFGVGAGFSLGRKVAASVGVFSSIGDLVSDATSGISADISGYEEFVNARARKAARDDAVSTFALHAGVTGDTADAKSYFNNVLRTKYLPEARGAAKLASALGGSRAVDPDLKTPLDKLTDKVTARIGAGFDQLEAVLR